MALDKELTQQVRGLDEYDLRRLGIFVRGLLLQRGAGQPTSKTDGAEAGKVGYRLEPVTCGKPGCKTCPHGPYWYAYWREGGRLRSRYIGRRLPPGINPPS